MNNAYRFWRRLATLGKRIVGFVVVVDTLCVIIALKSGDDGVALVASLPMLAVMYLVGPGMFLWFFCGIIAWACKPASLARAGREVDVLDRRWDRT